MFKEKLEKFSDNPGVYFFKKGKKILYIGKAKVFDASYHASALIEMSSTKK